MPYESAKFCLEQAGIKPSDVDEQFRWGRLTGKG